MQSFIDIIMIVIGIFVIGALLQSLRQSQKVAEDIKPEYKYRLVVTHAGEYMQGRQRSTIQGNSLEYLQQNLNYIAFYSIKEANVYSKNQLTHKMDATGVLREV